MLRLLMHPRTTDYKLEIFYLAISIVLNTLVTEIPEYNHVVMVKL